MREVQLPTSGELPVYTRIQGQLQYDREALFAHYRQGSQSLDPTLADRYGLSPTDSIGLSFLSGFGMVASTWYPAIRIESTIELGQRDMEIFNEEFGRRFIDRYVTVASIREALAEDPSGATFLEEMARLEFRNADDELAGALKAIAGARNLYEALTSAS